MTADRWAAIGLDGAKTEGAIVAVDDRRQVVDVRFWGPRGTYGEQAVMARSSFGVLEDLGIKEIALCYEEPVLWRAGGKPLWTALRSISYAVGIWMGWFPDHVLPVNPTTWRKAFTLPSPRAGRNALKEAALRVASAVACSGHAREARGGNAAACLLLERIRSGDPNVAEAYLIALYCWDLANLSRKIGKNPFSGIESKAGKRKYNTRRTRNVRSKK